MNLEASPEMGTPEWGADVGATEKAKPTERKRFRRRQRHSLVVGTWCR